MKNTIKTKVFFLTAILLLCVFVHANALCAAKMYFANESSGKIQSANLDGSGLTDVISGLTWPSDIALDTDNGKIYWIDLSVYGKIQCANLDGTGITDIITGLNEPYYIALDTDNEKLYWTDWGSGKIQSANLDGTGVVDLISGLNEPDGIALDIDADKMYWAEEFLGKIKYANLDGTGVTDLISGLIKPAGIALDIVGGKIYWTDFGSGKIQCANTDGTDITDLVTTGLAEPWYIALDIDADKMYWTDRNNNKIQCANLNGTGVTDLITLNAPMGIALDVQEVNYDLNEGLVGYWSFDEEEGTIAYDTSGLENHGTILGATHASGISNNALSFDGDDYVECSADSLPTAERTVSLWFYTDNLTTKPVFLGYGGAGGPPGTSWFMGNNGSNELYMSSHWGSNTISYTTGQQPTGDWYYFAVTTDESGTRLYFNGEEKISNTNYVNDTIVLNTDLAFGVCIDSYGTSPYTDGNVGYFIGLLDEIRIYDRALSAPEIQYLYENPDGNSCYGAPIAVSSYVYDGTGDGAQPSDFNPNYLDPGNVQLTDGIVGTTAYTDPEWVGFRDDGGTGTTSHPQVTFDFGSIYDVETIDVTFLTDGPAAIGPPDSVLISGSTDNITYSTPTSFTGFGTIASAEIRTTTLDVSAMADARYYRLDFRNSSQWTFLGEVNFVTCDPILIDKLFYSIDCGGADPNGNYLKSEDEDPRYQVKGIVGQPDAKIISGGIYTLSGGFLTDDPDAPPVQCSDGINNDNDDAGLVDFPDDKGCLHALDISELTADYNQDGEVNTADAAILAQHWLRYAYELDMAPQPDGDNIINIRDFAVMARHWLEGAVQ